MKQIFILISSWLRTLGACLNRLAFRWLVGCLIAAGFSACARQRLSASLPKTKDPDTYTVTVYVKNEAPFYGTGRLPFLIERPCNIELMEVERTEPVIKYVYDNITKEQYHELCNRLKDHHEVISIQKN